MPSVVRVSLSCGSLDALHAVRFTRRFPRHFHDTYAVGVVESGATRISTPAGQWVARAGDILAFSPGEIHRADPVDAAGYTYRMLYPSTDLVAALEIGKQPITPDRSRFPAPVIQDRDTASSLWDNQISVMTGCPAAPEIRLLEGLRTLLSRHLKPRVLPNHTRPREADLISAIQKYLSDNLARPVRLAEVAGIFGVNLFHMLRLFRRVVGETPHAYLVQLRVNHAQALLQSGESVARTAYRSGFSDQSHLTRVFRRAVGVPPGQYLRSVASQPTPPTRSPT